MSNNEFMSHAAENVSSHDSHDKPEARYRKPVDRLNQRKGSADIPAWLLPPVPQFKGNIRRHHSVMYEPSRERQYSDLKQQWLDTHPEATADECLAAFRRIAQRCGI